jgi:hypothetical protein
MQRLSAGQAGISTDCFDVRYLTFLFSEAPPLEEKIQISNVEV